jgi:predicted MFS family arabinose efflux permease
MTDLEKEEDNLRLTGEKRSSGRFTLTSLVFARGITAPPLVITGLLLIDIGNTFGVPVGVSGQIRTASFIVGIVVSLLMGALSVRFRHKSLLSIGLLIYGVSALGCYFAPNFNVMLIVYSLTGLAFSMVVPMVITLVAENLPEEKRAGAIGLTFAGASLANLFGTLIVNFIAGLSSWRWTFIGLILPYSILSYLLVSFNLPSKSEKVQSTTNKWNFVEGFKAVFSNKSAVACLVGTILSFAAYNFLLTYGASFLRQKFLTSKDLTSVLMMGMGLTFTLGSLVCGRIVKRYGGKNTTVLSTFLVGVLILSLANVSNLWLSIILGLISSLLAGVMITAFSISCC